MDFNRRRDPIGAFGEDRRATFDRFLNGDCVVGFAISLRAEFVHVRFGPPWQDGEGPDGKCEMEKAAHRDG